MVYQPCKRSTSAIRSGSVNMEQWEMTMEEHAKILQDECNKQPVCKDCPVFNGWHCIIGQPCTWDFPYIKGE